MRVLELQMLLEEKRATLCQIARTLAKRFEADEKELELYTDAINRLGGMLNSFHEQIGFKPYTEEYKFGKTVLSRSRVIHPKMRDKALAMELRNELKEVLDLIKAIGKKENKLKYRRVFVKNNKPVILENKYLSQRKASVRYLNDALELLDKRL